MTRHLNPRHSNKVLHGGWRALSRLYVAGLLGLTAICSHASASELPGGVRFRKEIQPVLTQYCYDCHGDGMSKGKVAFDEFKSDQELVGNRTLWWAALKNLRAGLMPPPGKPRPSADELQRLEAWIKQEAFQVDPTNPDPGRVTLRRLNRVEYRNTIRDLMGFDYKVEEELPPDDTGYGFDNIGDVLTVSPLLLEKYMQAAETIVASAVPRVAKVIPEQILGGNVFRRTTPGADNPPERSDRLSFYDDAQLSHEVRIEEAGSYRVLLEVEVLRQFEFDPGRCRVVFKIHDRPLLDREFGSESNIRFPFAFEEQWQPGVYPLGFELDPLVPVSDKKNSLDLRIISVRLQGPLEPEHWVRPKNFERFFTRDVPEGRGEGKQYAEEILTRFATKAFRRPVDQATVKRLVAIAEDVWSEPGKRFEDGIAQAMIPLLASPRFLFRVEDVQASESPDRHPLVDEYALASRLSYFLWSTMPDEELSGMAEKKVLRQNLAAQVKRMLADRRAEAFVENFVGQWLQVRDVDGIDINARAVLAKDRGEERQMQSSRRRFQELRDIPEEELTPEQKAELVQLQEARRRRFSRQMVELDGPLRRALRQETEMYFAHILAEDRSVLELLNSDYTFLNERLARHYGMTNVIGNEMRRVSLPPDHPRGGVLTHGSVLIVTSNPTRTSPVKRGLFILDNFLGTPPPPPPPDIPALEETESALKDQEPTLRETLEAHRSQPLCSSCHNRMDPLGLALENFNALGMWREKERNKPIDAAGKLVSGETFQDIRGVKHVLATQHQDDFYRCLTEKVLTYALGRGVEYYDVQTVDEILAKLQRDQGRFSTLLTGIIESASFQRRRKPEAASEVNGPGKERAEVKLETP